MATQTERLGSARESVIAIAVAVLAGAGVAVAGSQGGAVAGSVPVFALCVGLAFVSQWVAFVPAYLLQSERFYDLTGSLAYASVAALAVALSPAPDVRSILLLVLVVVWAARLVQRAGKDDRFTASRSIRSARRLRSGRARTRRRARASTRARAG